MFTIHRAPASTSTIVTLRCAPSKYQNSGPRAYVSDVQHPSPSFFHVLVADVGDARRRPRKHAAGCRPSGVTLNPSMLTSVVFQTSSRFCGRVDRKPRDRREVALLVVGSGVHPVAAVGGILATAPSRTRRRASADRCRPS